jgi:hypothetical protein
MKCVLSILALALLSPRFALPTAGGTTARVEVVLADGPVWKRHTIDNTSRGADGVKLGDINGDGFQDIVTGWEEGGEVRIYQNPGPRKSREPWAQVTVGKVLDAEDAIFADLDRDGTLEVVSCTEGQTRTVFWHRFSGNPSELMNADRWSTHAFPATIQLQQWMQTIAMDVDGEGSLDLVLASKNSAGTVGWLQAPPRADDLAAWKFHPLREAGWVMTLVAQDMDADGDPDVVFSDRKGARIGVFWLENPGTNAIRRRIPWREHAIGARGREAMFADIADVNADGLLDVAVAVKQLEIVLCLQHPRGTWQERIIRLDGRNLGHAKAVRIADLNQDNLPDMVFTCEGAKAQREGIVWLEQHPTGPWKQHSLGGPDGLKYDLIQLLDLDADGDLDVITCEETDQLGVVWYENPHH